MLSFLVLLLLVLITAVVIVVLRKNQQKHTKETADRTAPLPALGETLPDLATMPAADDEPDTGEHAAAGGSNDNWQLQVKTLRASQQYDAALELCRVQFPRIQAIQQAAIILRQQIRISQENNVPFDHLLQNLYNLAAFADVYSSNRHQPSSVPRMMAALSDSKAEYRSMGYRQLKLLNKSDIRLLEESWGKPESHGRAEDIYAL